MARNRTGWPPSQYHAENNFKTASNAKQGLRRATDSMTADSGRAAAASDHQPGRMGSPLAVSLLRRFKALEVGVIGSTRWSNVLSASRHQLHHQSTA
jgi:hypothetical protein